MLFSHPDYEQLLEIYDVPSTDWLDHNSELKLPEREILKIAGSTDNLAFRFNWGIYTLPYPTMDYLQLLLFLVLLDPYGLSLLSWGLL